MNAVNPCPTCKGEGFIDLGADARTCGECNGTGEERTWPVTCNMTHARGEMVMWAFGLLFRSKPINRRLGRAAISSEIFAFVRELGIDLAADPRSPHEPQEVESPGDRGNREAIPPWQESH